MLDTFSMTLKVLYIYLLIVKRRSGFSQLTSFALEPEEEWLVPEQGAIVGRTVERGAKRNQHNFNFQLEKPRSWFQSWAMITLTRSTHHLYSF